MLMKLVLVVTNSREGTGVLYCVSSCFSIQNWLVQDEWVTYILIIRIVKWILPICEKFEYFFENSFQCVVPSLLTIASKEMLLLSLYTNMNLLSLNFFFSCEILFFPRNMQSCTKRMHGIYVDSLLQTRLLDANMCRIQSLPSRPSSLRQGKNKWRPK